MKSRTLRAFGSESELETVQNVVAKRQLKHKRQLDATIEFHRVGAIKGVVLDADGKRVLLNLYQRFGIAQKEIEIDLSANGPALRGQVLAVVEAVEEALGAATSTGTACLLRQEHLGSAGGQRVPGRYLQVRPAGGCAA